MSIKDYFEKPAHIENVSTASLKVESNEFVLESKKRNETFQPYIDFSSASNFAKFGSAYEYYTKAVERVYGDYPYDGSQKEKIEYESSASYLDRYVFDKLYPTTTGYINFSYKAMGHYCRQLIENLFLSGAVCTPRLLVWKIYHFIKLLKTLLCMMLRSKEQQLLS